ncbi:MAG: hypothetical protein WCU00_01490 [Candidatus Latescibacterota bacterium]
MNGIYNNINSYVMIALGLLITLNSVKSYGFELNDIITIAEIGDNSIKTGYGTITYIMKTQQNYKKELEKNINNNNIKNATYELIADYNKTIEFRFDEKRYYVDEKCNDKNPIYRVIESYDGEKVSTLKYVSDEMGVVRPKGSIDNYYNKSQLGFDPRSFTTIFGESVAKFLRGNIQYIGEEIIKEKSYNVFEGNIFNEKVKVWLDKTLLYRPTKIEQLTIKNEKVIIENNYCNYGNDIFLKSIIIRCYSYDKIQNQWIEFNSSIYEIHNDSKFNLTLTNEMFNIEFPKGMRIHDKRINKYIEIK